MGEFLEKFEERMKTTFFVAVVFGIIFWATILVKNLLS